MLLDDDDQSAQNNEKSQTKPLTNDPNVCPEHEKNYEIICTTDLKMICPHCAIFGHHKNHKFKTIK